MSDGWGGDLYWTIARLCNCETVNKLKESEEVNGWVCERVTE